MSFISKWKQGIAEITPLQQMQSMQKGNWVMLFGLIAGIIVMLFKLKDFWWIEIILAASLFNHSITMLGVWQKIKMISAIENLNREQEVKNGF